MDRFTKWCLSGMILGTVFVGVLFCFSEGITGNDYWWHVKAGEWMVQNGQVLTRDVFSWTAADQPWIAHEWLSELLLYLLDRTFGDKGVFFFSLLGALLLIFLLLWYNRKRIDVNFIFSGIYFAIFSVNTYMFFYGRPQVFSFFLLFGELCCVYSFLEDFDSPLIYLIPGIGMLWANLHGGSSNLSYLLVIFLLVGGIPVRKAIGRLEFLHFHRKQVIRLLVVLCLTFFAVCANPFGIKMLWYPYEQMADTFMTSVIAEWGAPDAKDMGSVILFFLPVGLSVLGMLLSDKKIKIYDFLLMLFFLFLFFRSKRFIMLFFLSSSFWAFDYSLPCAVKPVKKRVEKLFIVLGLVVAMTIGIGFGGARLVRLLGNGDLVERELSEEMLEMVRSGSPKNVFNGYGLGGYLIYQGIPVFFDGRADLYGKLGILQDGLSLTLLTRADGEKAFNVEEIVKKYGIDGFLIEASSPLCGYLLSHPEQYELLGEDGGVAYFGLAASE